MKFVPIRVFDNYIEANIRLSQLKDAGIECWLKDEYTVTVIPFLTNAVDGIKLVVSQPDAKEAIELLSLLDEQNKLVIVCPNCRSNNVELVSIPRKAVNWLSAVISFLMGNYAVAVEKVFHCFECGHEFSEEEYKSTLN